MIHISYSFSLNRVRPSPQNGIVTKTDLTVTLSGSKTVTERRAIQSGRLSNQGSLEAALGAASGGGRVRWTVVSEHELRRIVDYPQNQTITDVRVNGKSCTAATQYVLKPGFKEFTLPRLASREIGYYTGVHVTSSSCRID